MTITLEKVREVANKLESALKNKGVCTSVIDGINLECILAGELASDSKKVLDYTPRDIDIEILKELSGKNKKLAARVISSIQRHLHNLQPNRFNLEVYDRQPKDSEALMLYTAANKAVEDGRIKNPWGFINGYGEKSFRVLEAYLKTRKII